MNGAIQNEAETASGLFWSDKVCMQDSENDKNTQRHDKNKTRKCRCITWDQKACGVVRRLVQNETRHDPWRRAGLAFYCESVYSPNLSAKEGATECVDE